MLLRKRVFRRISVHNNTALAKGGKNMDRKLNKIGTNLSIKPTLSTFRTQAISQPDSRGPKTNMAIPDDDNVALNKEWVEVNKK